MLEFRLSAVWPAIADDRSRARDGIEAPLVTIWGRALSLSDTEASLHGSGVARSRGQSTSFHRALAPGQSAPALERGSASHTTLTLVASASKEAMRSQNDERARRSLERPRGRNCPLSRCGGTGYGIPVPRFSTFTWKLGPELQFSSRSGSHSYTDVNVDVAGDRLSHAASRSPRSSRWRKK